MPKLTPRLRRFLVIAVLAALVGWLGSTAFVTWKLTRRGRPIFAEPPPTVAWGVIESQRLKTADGQELGAWLVRGDRHKGCVLLLHGINNCRSGMLPVIQMLAQERLTVLAPSLRCHGDSTGSVNDVGWSARHDVVAGVEFLRRQFPGEPIYVMGDSMGAAAAIFAAGQLQDRVAGYFFNHPYKDLDTAVWNRLQHQLGPGLDWVAYGGLKLWAPLFLPIAADRVSPYDSLQDIPATVPVVFVTGSADPNARLPEVQAMYQRIRSHAKLVVFEGAGHKQMENYDRRLFRATLLQFLESGRH
ncbi:MAG: alpha/beta hydrolase [Thermoguttaceae bacterium]